MKINELKIGPDSVISKFPLKGQVNKEMIIDNMEIGDKSDAVTAAI